MKKLLLLILTANIFLSLFFAITIKQALAEEDIYTCWDANDADTSGVSRPAACELCSNWQEETNTYSCASPFTVSKDATFEKKETEKIIWQSWYRVDPGETVIPFVGLSGQESESNYLGDYFEGTSEYYIRYGDQTTLPNYQGVLRKLTPFEFQNQLKKQIIARVPLSAEMTDPIIEKPVHDYIVRYVGRLCWDVPFWMDAGRFIFNEIVNLIINKPIDIFNFLKDKFINKPIGWINNTFNTEIQEITDVEIKIDLKIANYGNYCIYEDPKSPGQWLLVKGLNVIQRITGFGALRDILDNYLNKIPGLIHFSPLEMQTYHEAKLSEIREHMPPNPNDEKYKKDYFLYRKDFLNWKYDENKNLTKWYLLWQSVPLVSREDERGEVKAYVENPEMIILFDRDNDDRQVEFVPHLARLYESSKITNQMLIKPKDTEEATTEVKNDTSMACFKENYMTGEGDTLCCNTPIDMRLTFLNEEDITQPGGFKNPYYDQCVTELNALKEKCASLIGLNPISNLSSSPEIVNCYKQLNALEEECSGTTTETISQELGVGLIHPYLDLIWKNTSHPQTGIFNIFRPNKIPTFEDIDAASTIKYSNVPSDPSVEVAPTEGRFFYPHLGGIQKAKEWVVNQALRPYTSKK